MFLVVLVGAGLLMAIGDDVVTRAAVPGLVPCGWGGKVRNIVAELRHQASDTGPPAFPVITCETLCVGEVASSNSSDLMGGPSVLRIVNLYLWQFD
ncbi:hypothetical protein GGR57DRAFT_393684 [Xylariaceae sp. FL1272]|nr:hypothetical protein GGR57DRAFT_393684 [Xylariaceae sp. FL1272]